MEFSTFANRYQRSSGTTQLMEDLGAAKHRKGPVYMLGGGNPALIPEATDAFKRVLTGIIANETAFDRTFGQYDTPQGNARFCEELATLLNDQFDWGLSADNIAITNGSQSSFGLLFNSLAGSFPSGDFRRILLPLTPEYIGYSDVGLADESIFAARKPDIELLDNGLFKYRVAFDDLTIDKRYGAVCVSRPTNPTGNVITDGELAHLRGLCRDADIPLIIDGAYGLPFPNMVFSQATPIWDDDIILCLSLSKLGLPGLRTGIVVANADIIGLVRNANAINSLAPGGLGPEMAAQLIARGELLSLCENTIRPFYVNRLDHAMSVLRDAMGDLPVRIHKPEGALFLWLWFEGLPVTSLELYERLAQQGVYVIPGEHFFPGIDDAWQHRHECIRVNYAGPEDVVETGLKLIADTARRAFAA